MIIRIDNYDSVYRVVTLIKTYEEFNKNKDAEKQILYVNDYKAILIHENKEFILSERSYNQFCECNDYDVFEIGHTGNALRYFSCSSMDNAILVTNKCNSNCIMCPTSEIIRQKQEEYTAEELINIIRHFPTDAEHITITGGEPFVIKKDMFVVLKYLKENYNNTKYLLLTNGRAFCINEYAYWLNETSPSDLLLGIPIHGHNQNLHDYITQSEGSFYQTVQGIKNLLRYKLKIELRIVVSKLNMGYIYDISEFIKDNFKGVNHVNFIGLEMTGNAAKNTDKVWIDYSKAYLCSEKAIDNLVCSGFDVSLYNFPLCFVKTKHWMLCANSISDYKIRYTEKCNQCFVKDACGGMFAGTIRFEKNNVKPVMRK